jgi:hypothetical protein
MSASLRVLQPGESTPELTLPRVNHQGVVSLAVFRAMGRSVLIAFMRGLHCPFSRRQISMLTSMKAQLEAEHADIVVVVNTTLERARLYFQYWPTEVVVAADPGVESHRSFGLGETADMRQMRGVSTSQVAFAALAVLPCRMASPWSFRKSAMVLIARPQGCLACVPGPTPAARSRIERSRRNQAGSWRRWRAGGSS